MEGTHVHGLNENRSEKELHSKPDIPWLVSFACDESEAWRTEDDIGQIKLRVIKCVKAFGSEFQFKPVTERKILTPWLTPLFGQNSLFPAAIGQLREAAAAS